MIGASMLWVGWFGFNGGSQLAADGGAAMALTVTHISAATSIIDMGAVGKDQIRQGVLGWHRHRYDCRFGIHHPASGLLAD